MCIRDRPWTQDRQVGELDLLRLQTAMGFTAEDFDLIIEDMAALGKEPTYCMGDDIPLAVLSDKPHLLYDTSSSVSPRSPTLRSTPCGKSW